MKITYISTGDTKGGAAKSAFRFYKEMKKKINIKMFVMNKGSNEVGVIGVKSNIKKLINITRPSLENIFLLFYKKKNGKGFYFSTNFLGENLKKILKNDDSEIVHIHWVNGSYIRLGKLFNTNKKIVITLHDSWFFTGGCHLIPDSCVKYKEECGCCELLESPFKKDISFYVQSRKKEKRT